MDDVVAAQVILPLQRMNKFTPSLLARNSPQHLEQTLARWRKNASRLYARRIMEIAAASAALYMNRVRMQEAVKDTPTQWVDWEQKDWTDALMSSVGGNALQRFISTSKQLPCVCAHLCMGTTATTRTETLTETHIMTHCLFLSFAAYRLMSLAALASPLVLLAPFTLVSTKAQDLSWEYALWGIEQAGPTLIKLVQWATTRQDMFSQEFCLHFGKLRDETRGHSWKATQEILQQDFGDNFQDWMQLETTPIGSGCIAQVYRGKLLKPVNMYPQDTEIALKVQHPGIWHKVCADFYILDKISHFLESIPYLNLEYLSLRDTVQQFCNIMLPQLDLREEESHLKRFNTDFANDEKVSFPEPIMATPKVLLETYQHGSPILTYVNAPLEKRQELARLGCATTLKMIFLNDFVHGDLHPGT